MLYAEEFYHVETLPSMHFSETALNNSHLSCFVSDAGNNVKVPSKKLGPLIWVTYIHY